MCYFGVKIQLEANDFFFPFTVCKFTTYQILMHFQAPINVFYLVEACEKIGLWQCTSLPYLLLLSAHFLKPQFNLLIFYFTQGLIFMEKAVRNCWYLIVSSSQTFVIFINHAKREQKLCSKLVKTALRFVSQLPNNLNSEINGKRKLELCPHYLKTRMTVFIPHILSYQLPHSFF